MMRKGITQTQKILKRIIFALFSIIIYIILLTPVQATIIPESEFAAEVLLNKQGISYDLSPLEEYAEHDLVEIRDVDGVEKFYIYKSHYNSEIAVIIRGINSKLFYPPGPNYTEKDISGLSIILSIPTEWDETTIEYEVVQLKFDFELNLTYELITFMESQNYKNEDSGNIELDGKYVNLEFSNEETIIILSSGEGGKTAEGLTSAGESIIWARGLKNSFEESVDQDMKDMLQYLNLAPNNWDEADKRTESNPVMIEVPTIDWDIKAFDWKVAMQTELEWLISENIIMNLKKSDIQDIIKNTKAGHVGYNNRVMFENGTWKPFSETEALKQRPPSDLGTFETNFDLSNTLNNLNNWIDDGSVPGKSGTLPLSMLSIVGGVLLIIVIGTFSYTRLKRKSVLDNLNRKNIYESIKSNPGIHYMALQRELDIPLGVLAYHLNVLEKREYIKSMQDSKYRRFYLSGVKSDLKMALTTVQMRILNVVNKNPGISQSKISENIGKNRMLVNYHIRILTDAGILALEKNGRNSQCYTTSTTAFYITE
jgi:predicted transcriptional regulator